MLCIEELINLDPFQQLPKEQLEWVCDRAQTVELCAGNVLVHEGDPAHGLFILILNLSSLPNQWGVVQDSVWKPFAGL